jgi:hypothetical protein
MPAGKLSFSFDVWKEIISRLTPKVLAVLIALAMVLLAAVLLVAVLRGSDVSFWGVQISQPSIAHMNEIESLKAQLQQAIPLADLKGVIDSTGTKTAALQQIKKVALQYTQLTDWESKFSFKLFKLELLITRYGRFIATNMAGEERREAYQLIQSVLADVDFYQGDNDGSPQKTHDAVVAFQNDYNTHMPEGAKIQALGNFGFQTLEAIRSRYRLISAG